MEQEERKNKRKSIAEWIAERVLRNGLLFSYV